MKIQSIDSKTFAVDGNYYAKGDYSVEYRNNEKALIRNKYSGNVIGDNKFVPWVSFVDSNDNRYDTYINFVAALNEIVGGNANYSPQGVQGPVGPAGVPGPIGPAGLTWKGQWNSATAYVKDDAVGFSGASWFCIANASAGLGNPSLNTTNWALLASQGAQGIQGPQGPQGIPGPAGGSVSSGALEYTAQIYQEGITNIQPEYPQIDTISQGVSADANYRAVSFLRTGVGTYKVKIKYRTQYFVNTNKVSISFSDGNIRITDKFTGIIGTMWEVSFEFKTYTPAGVLSDGLLLGNNGTFINIKLYN